MAAGSFRRSWMEASTPAKNNVKTTPRTETKQTKTTFHLNNTTPPSTPCWATALCPPTTGSSPFYFLLPSLRIDPFPRGYPAPPQHIACKRPNLAVISPGVPRKALLSLLSSQGGRVTGPLVGGRSLVSFNYGNPWTIDRDQRERAACMANTMSRTRILSSRRQPTQHTHTRISLSQHVPVPPPGELDRENKNSWNVTNDTTSPSTVSRLP